MRWPDFFGRRARAELEEVEQCHRETLAAWGKVAGELDLVKEANLRLIAQLREMDQGTFQISQVAPDWARIRPIFVKMQAAAEKRMQNESGRIKNLMIGEIITAYNEPGSRLVGHHDGTPIYKVPKIENKK